MGTNRTCPDRGNVYCTLVFIETFPFLIFWPLSFLLSTSLIVSYFAHTKYNIVVWSPAKEQLNCGFLLHKNLRLVAKKNSELKNLLVLSQLYMLDVVETRYENSVFSGRRHYVRIAKHFHEVNIFMLYAFILYFFAAKLVNLITLYLFVHL